MSRQPPVFWGNKPTGDNLKFGNGLYGKGPAILFRLSSIDIFSAKAFLF